jgi:hypothetical protein
MKASFLASLVGIILLSGCGPTAEEQRVMDQQKCAAQAESSSARQASASRVA